MLKKVKKGKSEGRSLKNKDIIELSKSEQKYRELFNQSISTIYLFDKNKKFIDSNQSGLDLLGYSREELLNLSIPNVDADKDAVESAHKKLDNGSEIINFEHKLIRKDGKIITVLNNSKPLKDSKGFIIGIQSTLIDITKQKEVEDELREKIRELEKLNQIMVGRELRMVELKKKLKKVK